MGGLLALIGGGALVGAICAGIVFYQVGHWKGEGYGREAERHAALQKSMELIRERSETDEQIGRMSAAELCSELGGIWVRDEQRCE